MKKVWKEEWRGILERIAKQAISDKIACNNDLLQDKMDTEEYMETIKRDEDFWNNVDDVKHHEEKWHQYGIISHMIETWECWEEEVKDMLREWKCWGVVEKHFSGKIGNKTFGYLFEVAIMLHDIGKFSGRKVKREKDGSWGYSFKGHDIESGRLVRSGILGKIWSDWNMFDGNQREYIARVAELHFELGKIRKAAKSSSEGFTMAYVDSEKCAQDLKDILNKIPGYELEVVVFFLIDSLGKMEYRMGREEELEKVREEILRNGNNVNLLKAVKQLPLNISLTKRALEMIL